MTKLAIILKNKLESIDTILPIINALQPEKCIFYCQSNHHRNILERNNFLFDELISYGKISVINNKDNFFISKINNLFFFLNLIILLLRKFRIIHFGKLDRFPFFLLVNLFKSQIIFSDSNSFNDERMNLKRVKKNLKKKKLTFSKNIITYCEENKHQYQNLNYDNLILTGPPRFYNEWTNYLRVKSVEYFRRYHPELNKNEKYVILFISSLNYENFFDNDYYDQVIDDILLSINKIYPEKKILIKPHPTTREEKLHKIIKNNKYKNLILTYMQPNLILENAYLAITELFGTVMIDANKMGIPTIEYTKYDNQTLELTNNYSIGKKFIDHFINFNKNELEVILKNQFVRKPTENSLLNPRLVEFINN